MQSKSKKFLFGVDITGTAAADINMNETFAKRFLPYVFFVQPEIDNFSFV